VNKDDDKVDEPQPSPPPAGLKAAGTQLWTSLTSVYDFSCAPERLLLLEQAARTADVVDRLQRDVDQADSLREIGSMKQPVAMPEAVELRQHRAQLASLIRAVGCPDDDQEALSRSQLGKLGARARWSR
jgi:hypothetical protein